MISRQADMFANRVAKNYARLAPAFARRQVDVFRLYDRDIPEIRAVADWYAGHLVVGEYARTQTDALPGWLQALGEAAAGKLGLPADRVHFKRRRTRPEIGQRYSKLSGRGERVQVQEGPLLFLANLDDYLDCGLFADHRETRAMVAAESAGKRGLNLFCYTGSFTVAMAKGGAAGTVSVDTSATYLDWLRDNLRCNGVDGPQHACQQIDARNWLDWAARHGERFDVVVCDPPSFSDRGDFDVQRDHRSLVQQCLAVLKPGGALWFCCNHQRFLPDLEGLPCAEMAEMTARTVPADYRNRQAHRSWRIVAQPSLIVA